MKVFVLQPTDLSAFAHLFPESLLHELPADTFLLGCADEESMLPAGILMAHVRLRTLTVDWLYVDEPFRRRGGAGDMMELLLDCASQLEELENVTVLFSQEHQGMGPFLRAMDFSVLFREGTKGFETKLGAFRMLPGEKQIPGKLLPLHSVEQTEIDRFAQLLEKGVLPGVGIAALRREDYRPESMAYLENGTLLGLWLVQERDGKLLLPWFCNYSKSLTVPIGMMNASIRALKEVYPEDTPVCFASLSARMEQVISKMFREKKHTEIYMAVYGFQR